MRVIRDDGIPRDALPLEVRIRERDDFGLGEADAWLRENGRGWYAMEPDNAQGLTWVFSFSDPDTALWFKVKYQ